MAINLSASILFHFTNKLERLESILTNYYFVPRYCWEPFSDFNIAGEFMELAIPMSCFCDIRLSQIHEHIGTYGKYGIGLTKIWGENKHLNPLLYGIKNSLLIESINKVSENIYNSTNLSLGFDVDNIIKYLKPYKGICKKTGIGYLSESPPKTST